VPVGRRRGYVPHHRPTAPTPPRHQAAWRTSQPSASSSSSSGSVRAREGVVLLRRSSSKAVAGDQSKGGTSHERKSKGGNKVVPSASSSSPPSSSTATATGKQAQKGAGSGGGNWKGRKSGWEARFLFKEPEAAGDAATPAAPAQEMDTRTTVMIRNIPNKYRYPRQSPHCRDTAIFHGRCTLRTAILLMLEASGSQPEAAAQHAGQPLHPLQRADRGERRGRRGPALLLLRFRLPPHRFQVSTFSRFYLYFMVPDARTHAWQLENSVVFLGIWCPENC
jgi:hypothetical protein